MSFFYTNTLKLHNKFTSKLSNYKEICILCYYFTFYVHCNNQLNETARLTVSMIDRSPFENVFNYPLYRMYPISAILHSFVRAPKAKRTILKFLSENNFDDPRRKIAFVLRFPRYLAPGYKQLKTNITILNILINFNNEWSSIDESKPMKSILRYNFPLKYPHSNNFNELLFHMFCRCSYTFMKYNHLFG